LTAKLVNRPVFQVDDQSALVYLILYGDPKWKEFTHIEWEFLLHGYWKYVVDTYEELAKNHLGYGDERWPFVTHFVGCKPCKFRATLKNDECFKQMERAFNFADNQVLERYGFSHAALGSFKTQKIRKDSADPLGVIQQQGEQVKVNSSTLKQDEQVKSDSATLEQDEQVKSDSATLEQDEQVKSESSTLKQELDQVDTEEAMSELDFSQDPLKLSELENDLDLPE